MRKILSGHLNNRGVTLITLIIAITIFAVFITVFSYVMIAKHGSEALYVQSTRAYAVAQAGIEYGIRYVADATDAADTAARYAELEDQDPDPNFNRDLGNGSFTLIYTPGTVSDPSTLTSTGTVGTAVREITVSHFRALVKGKGISRNTGYTPQYHDHS